MAVSLTKKSTMREYMPDHIRSEEETLPPKLMKYTPEHIAVEPAPQPLTKNYSTEDPDCPGSINVEVIDSDLTVYNKDQLCCMMEYTTNQICVLYEKIENLTAEAEHRAKYDDFWNENHFGNVYFFHEKVGKRIAKANRRYRRRHFLDSRSAFKSQLLWHLSAIILGAIPPVVITYLIMFGYHSV